MSREFRSDIEMQVVARDRSVVLLFSRKNSDGSDLVPAMTDNMVLDPEVAMFAGQKLCDMAFEADTSLKPVGPALKASLIEKHRSVLIPRIATMMGSLRENKMVTSDQLAKQLVDVMCHEVFE